MKDAIAKGLAYVPEDRLTEGLFLPHSINNNTVAATVNNVLGRGKLISKQKTRERTKEWIDELSIVTPSGELPVQSLSGGNQQRVVLAKWLSTKPKVLILNSPTVGVDIGSKTDIHAYARKLAGQGMGVIIISDDIPEVLDNCNRVLVMRKGRIVGRMNTCELTPEIVSHKLSEA